MEKHNLTQSRQTFSFLMGVVFCCLVFPSSSIASGWVVQLGSFGEEKNARDFVSRIKKKGYTPFVIKGENSKWHKVRVGPYPSKEEARQVVSDLRKRQDISAMVIFSKDAPPDQNDDAIANVDAIDIVVSQLLIWLQAWEQGEIEKYLSFYSDNFKAPNKSRRAWERGRRYILSRNSGITIQVSDMEMKQNDETIEMSFTQDFKSDRVSDIGRKELIWKNEGNGWKIIKETWSPS